MNQEKLLYQSRGCSAKLKFFAYLFSGMGILMSLLMFAISFWGINRFDQDESIEIIIIAFAFLAASIVILVFINSYRSCWIKLYDTAWEGKPFVAFGQSASLKFSYSDTQNVQLKGAFLQVTVNGVTHKMICTEPERALQIISSKIRATR